MMPKNEMMALSMWQPWASLVSVEAKKWETRGWSTNYRGPLAIHAAKRWTIDQKFLINCWPFQAALGPLVGQPVDLTGRRWWGVETEHLPFGAVIAVCELVDCIKTDGMTQAQIGTDRPFGDFSLGRYAWKLENMRRLPVPIPAVGRQGLWKWQVPEGVAV